VEPAALTVRSSVLWTVLGGDWTSERICVETGFAVTVTMEWVDVELAVVGVLCILSIPSTSEAIAAACEVVSTEDVLEVDDGDENVDTLLLVAEVDVCSISGIEPSSMIVTVCVTGTCACGITKFGAMLIDGCFCSNPSH